MPKLFHRLYTLIQLMMTTKEMQMAVRLSSLTIRLKILMKEMGLRYLINLKDKQPRLLFILISLALTFQIRLRDILDQKLMLMLVTIFTNLKKSILTMELLSEIILII